MARQTTLAAPFAVAGATLHSGRRTHVRVSPASPGSGRRIGAGPGSSVAIDWRVRLPSLMSTTIGSGEGWRVRTVEHLLAALSACRVDNVLIEVRGEEIPILDGSAAVWCRRIGAVGVVEQPAERRVVRVLKPVQIQRDGGFVRVEPARTPSLDVTFDLLRHWPRQRWSGPLDVDTFRRDLMRARSFGDLGSVLGLARGPRVVPPGGPEPNAPDVGLVGSEGEARVWADLEARKAAGEIRKPLLRGARPGRVLVSVGGHVFGRARYADEPVRHVALDMIGDLALAGAPVIGRVVAHNPSHEKTFALVATLMADPSAWEWILDPRAS